MVEGKDAYRILVVSWRVRVHFEELGLNGRQYYNGFQATGLRVWNGLIWHRVGICARLRQMQGVSCLAEELLLSSEGLCSVESVSYLVSK
jgi:hypothetical protein